jgi:hypothetical protein
MMTDKEILRQFKHSTIKDIVEMVLRNVLNYTFEKGEVSGYSINVWRVKPVQDEGSFCYYENKNERDHDFNLLSKLVMLQTGTIG